MYVLYITNNITYNIIITKFYHNETLKALYITGMFESKNQNTHSFLLCIAKVLIILELRGLA